MKIHSQCRFICDGSVSITTTWHRNEHGVYYENEIEIEDDLKFIDYIKNSGHMDNILTEELK